MVRRALCLLVLVSLAGCQRDSEPQAAEVPAHGGVKAPAPARVLTSAAFQQSTLTLVSRGKQVSASTFERLRATLGLSAERIESLELRVHLDSVVGSDKATLARLKAREAFDAASKPLATFRSTQVEAGSAPHTFLVKGELELLGARHAVTFPVRVTLSAQKVELDAELELTREQWLNAVGDKAASIFDEGFQLAAHLSFPRAPAAAPSDKTMESSQ